MCRSVGVLSGANWITCVPLVKPLEEGWTGLPLTTTGHCETGEPWLEKGGGWKHSTLQMYDMVWNVTVLHSLDILKIFVTANILQLYNMLKYLFIYLVYNSVNV